MKKSMKKEQSKLVCYAECENFRLKGKRFMTIVALTCAVAFQVNAQNIVEDNKKIAEQTVKLADANPTDGQKQYAAASALIGIAVNTDGQYDRAISYAHKALEIAKAQKEQKDTLLANTYSLLSNIYLLKGNVDNTCDFMELSPSSRYTLTRDADSCMSCRRSTTTTRLPPTSALRTWISLMSDSV